MHQNGFDSVRRLEFLDTHGDQITPGSDVVGEQLQLDRLAHRRFLFRKDCRFAQSDASLPGFAARVS
jgi:hypothetical protein